MASIFDDVAGPAKRRSIFDDVPADQPPPSSSTVRRLTADPALTLAKGVIGLGEGAVGLADIATAGRAGKALSDLTGFDPKRAKAMLDEYLTPEQRAANEAVQKAEGFVPTLQAIASNPSVIPHAIIESAPSMLGGGAIGRGARAVGGAIGAGESVLAPAAARLASRGQAPLRAAIGEGAISGGQTAEQIRQENPDGTLTAGQTALAAGSGALTGAIARMSGGVAKKLGISDIDVALAGGATGRAGKGMLRRAGEGFVTEGLLEELPQSAQEQAAQNLALGKPIGEGVGQAAALGAVTGGVQGGLTAAALPGRKPTIAEPPREAAPPETFDQQFERAYGVAPGGLTKEQATAIAQLNAERDLEPRRAAPFDAGQYFEGFPPSEPPPPPAPPADPLHAPNAGPISRAAGKAVDAGLTPNPYQPAPTEAFAPRTEVTQPPDLQMQNRDRSRPGSIQQMQAIANSPDYDRLGVGRSPNEAAPMVAVGANAPVIPESDFGRRDRVTMGDNSKLDFRYAVVEAPTVLASHNADGSVNGDYFAQVPPGTVRALNNGRVAALQEAYRRGTAEQYRQAMIADAQAHGIAPEAIAGKKNPILVRVYDDAENARPNMAAISNPQLSLRPSAPEQAQNDAVNIDPASFVPDEQGNVLTPENEPALRKFLATIPAAEHNELVTKGGFTQQFANRVRGAIFAKAYGNAEIVANATEDPDPETKNVLTAMVRAAPEFAKVAHGVALDIRPAVVEAIGVMRSARARGIPATEVANHPDLFERDPMTKRMVDFLSANARSANRMAAALTEAARFLQDEDRAASSADMFGRRPAEIGDLIARVNAHLEKSYGSEAVGLAAEQQAAYAAGREAERAGSRGDAAPDDGRGQPDQQQGAAAATQPAQAEPEVAPFEYEPYPKLTPEHRAIETRFGEWAKQNVSRLRAAYAELPDAEGGVVLNVDTARELDEAYRGDRTLAGAVHEPSSAIIKRLYAEMLAEEAPTGKENLVLFTAGGTGAGKSTGIKASPALAQAKSAAQIVYDTNLNTYSSGKKKIQQALDAGKAVVIAYTYRDPLDALVNGALPRAESQRRTMGSGRTVPIEEHLKTHTGAAVTIRKLAEDFRNDPRVAFRFIDNANGWGKAKEVNSLDELPEIFDNTLGDRLNEAIENEYQAGRISEATYRGFLGEKTAPDRGRAESHRGQDGGGNREEPQRERGQAAEVTRVGAGKAQAGPDGLPPKDKPLVLVLGGTYNPVHTMHVQTALDARDYAESLGYKVRKVLLAPVGQKLADAKAARSGEEPTSLADRTEMIRRAVGSNSVVDAVSGPGEEADAITTKLRRTQLADWVASRYPGATVVNVTGSDQAVGHPPGFPSVYQGDPGTAHDGYFYMALPRDEGTVSSSKIRAAIAKGEPLEAGWMAPGAEAYYRQIVAKRPRAAQPQAGFLTSPPQQGDLFASMQRTVLVEVEKKVDAERDTPKGKTAREAALRDLAAGGRVNLLAASINVDMIRDGTASILGQQVTSAKDIAALAQVYRDPRFETLRYIFTKGGKVVHQIAVSCRLPSMTVAFNGEWNDFVRDMGKTMHEVGAERFYMLHNHPSGNSAPSYADLELTKYVGRNFPNAFAGHVVIDTNEYSLIGANGVERSRAKANFGGAAPHLPQGKAIGPQQNVLGRMIDGYLDVATVGVLVKQPGRAALIGVTVKQTATDLIDVVTYAGDLDMSLLADVKKVGRVAGIISRVARASGSGGGMFLTNVPAQYRDNALWLLRRGVLRDVTLESGENLRPMAGTRDDLHVGLGRGLSPTARVAVFAAQKQADYASGDLFGNTEAADTKRRAAVRKKAAGIPGIKTSQLDLFAPPADTGSEAPKGGDNGQSGKGGSAGVGGQGAIAVPATGTGGETAGVLPGAGGRDTGSRGGNDSQRPGNQEGVGQQERPVVDGEGGRGEQPASGGAGNRPSYLSGVPAGRDIPAKTGRNFAFGDDDLNYSGGWLTKGQQNVAALKLLRELEKDGRQATRDEQAILAKYVGWGASELANKIFGDTLEGAEKNADRFAAAMRELDRSGGDALYRGERGYLDAYELMASTDGTFDYGNPITRKQLAAKKPDSALKGWIALRAEVKELLTPEEWTEASKSTQYAHYTSKEVVRGMWAAMRRMGFQGGALLEPGSGIGVFPGLMDPDVANNTAYTGIEFEPIAGGILKQLFPDERIVLGDFTKTALPKDFYDAAIGNPPFSSTKIKADPEYRKHGFRLHDYFFAKTIDRVKPGGLLMFVSSRGTLDKRDDQARQYLAERADLVGAIRLPQTAFKKNAGTEVVTDVLFLRKKVPGETFEHGQAWLDSKPLVVNGKPMMEATEKGLQPIFVNEYFHAHPEMVLGDHATTGAMRKAKEYTVTPREGDIAQHFLTAVQALPENVYRANIGTSANDAKTQQLDLDPKAKKEGGFYLSKDGVLMRVSGGVGRPHTTQSAVLKSYIPLRDALKQAQYDQLNNGPWEASLAALQKAYKAFVRQHGNILENKPYERESTRADEVTGEPVTVVNKYRRWKHAKELEQDPDYWLVAALEEIDEESDAISPAKALTERVLQKPSAPEIKTAADALLATLNETGKVDIKRIAELASITEEEAVAGLAGSIYRVPSGEWQTADEYLSGDVRQKLKDAMEAAASDKRFAANVEALRAVQPREIPHTEIDVALGAPFIKPEVYERFAREKLGAKVKVDYIEKLGKWIVEGTETWREDNVGGMRLSDILGHAMSGAPIRIERTVDPKKGPEFDPDATAAANARVAQMGLEFRQWLWSDDERRAEIVKDYNNTFNTVVPRQFDGRHLTLPGTSRLFNIFDHVKRGAWRIIQSGNTYLAHAVGSGKTFQMVISAMEQKRLGLIKKPMMVVPRHMLAQFASEWQALYPTARLMIADEKAFHTDVRREFVARAALSDLDGIVITHSAFKLLDLDPEFKQKVIERELEDFRDALIEAGGDPTPQYNRNGKRIRSRDPKIKQIEASIEALEQQLEAAASSEGKDKKAARFDEMGVDMLYIDEAHEYRRLAYPTQRQMKGIQPAGSQQAFDLWMKSRYLEEKNPGRSLVMASGTPVTNTVAELYNVIRMMDPAALEAKGIASFDRWADMFGRPDTKLEPDAGGSYVNVTRFAQFANLPELAQMFRKFADVLNSDDLGKLLGDKRPTVKGGTRKIAVTPMTPELRAYREELRRRMEVSKDWKPSFDEPNNPDPVIRIIGDGRLAAIDMRFADPSLPSNPESKLNTMIDGILRVYGESNDPARFGIVDKNGNPIERGTQIVFSDIGFGEGVTERRGFNARAWLVKRLRDGGVPANEIAFIGDYNTAQKRLTLFRAMNEGKVRILIGGSRNLGTGTNVQKRLVALHHLDTPWFPAHVEQREGRIIRADNLNKEVQVYGYATKGSYDETMWKLVATKQRFVEQAMSGDPNLRAIQDVSEVGNYEMASAMLADDERVLQLAGLRSEVEQLRRLYNSHEDDRGRAIRELQLAQAQTERVEKRALPEAEKLAAKVQDLSGDKFTAKVGDTVYTKRKDFGEALNAASKALAVKITEGDAKIGEISGFPIMFKGRLIKDFSGKPTGYEPSLWMSDGKELHAFSHSFNDDPIGLAMRVSNLVANLATAPQRLREFLNEQKARIHALTPKIDAKFPMLQELLDKQAEADALELDIQNNPAADDEPPSPLAKQPQAPYRAERREEPPKRVEQSAPPYGWNQPWQPTPPPPLQAALNRQPGPPKDAPDWVKKAPPEMQEALRKAGVWAPKKTLKERVREIMQDAGLKLLQGTLDRFAPVLKRLGDYPYKLLRMASAYDAGLEASLFHGRLKVNSVGALEVERNTKGLIEILQPLQGEIDRFLSWVAGNRAERLKVEDRENLFGDTDIAQLKKLNQKLHPTDHFPNGQSGDTRAIVYAKVLRDFSEYQRSIMDIAEASGLVDRAGRAQWEHDFYVPFYREAEKAAPQVGNVSGMVNQYPFKRLKGGTGILHDLLENSIQNWSHLLQAALKNRAARETLDRAVQVGAAHKAAYNEKGSVYVRVGGKEQHYVVDDPLILDAVASLEATPFRGPAMRFFGAFKQALTFGATVSPTFRIRNLIRDTVQSLSHGQGTYNPVKVWIEGFKYSGKNNPEFGNLLAGGGIFQMGSHLEGNRADYVRRLTKKGVKAITIIDSENKAKAALSAMWDWWQDTGNRAENINRANRYHEVYAALTKAGTPPDRAHFEASYAARDIMDFSLHGRAASVRMLIQMVPFMNARLQGLYKLGRAASEDPRRFAAVVGGVTLASIALLLAYRDDPDWKEREEWDRDNNWWFKIGDTAYRIPKPFEIGALGTVIERATEVVLDGMQPADRERFVNRLWPLIASQLSMNPIPQALSPAIQLWANKNAFTGRPIESEHDMRLPKEQRIGANTSQVAKLLGKAGLLSPEQIDFTVNAYLAWVGTHALATADLALRPLMGEPERPAKRLDQYFVVGDFARDLPASQSRFVSQFYEHLKKTQEAMGELRNAQQLGLIERAAEIAREGKPDLRLATVYSQAARSMSEINARVRQVQASPTMDADEKRATIDRLNALRNRMAQAVENARARAVNQTGA